MANAATIAAAVKKNFRIKVPHSLLTGPGEISDLYLVGPILDNGTPNELPRLLIADYATGTNESRGRANSLVVNGTIAAGDKFPRARGATAIPWPLLLGEIVETVPMDTKREDSPNRVYGRININTASAEVLQRLPWPTGVNAATAATAITTYRDAKGGFLTPGEVTLALDGLVTPATETLDFNRDTIYAAISSCITVNSDIYAVTIRVQIGNSPTPSSNESWYYLA
ncbi:MAG: helix-hairpin-helix domain-containing protein, partial [bacterium]|nr:helix-hairpin-helix domain-containing protein [bacterium]